VLFSLRSIGRKFLRGISVRHRGGSETGNIDRAPAGEKGTNRSELKTVQFRCHELTKTITGTREPQRLGLIPSNTTRILGSLTKRGTKSRETARHSVRRWMNKKKRKERRTKKPTTNKEPKQTRVVSRNESRRGGGSQGITRNGARGRGGVPTELCGLLWSSQERRQRLPGGGVGSAKPRTRRVGARRLRAVLPQMPLAPHEAALEFIL
jgi:hypothetical protein